jgi:Leucine-rich repeat (LRR) protein
LPGLVGAFAAPALFGLMLAAAVGAIPWNVSAEARAKAELAELGVEVSPTPRGLQAEASKRFKADKLTRIGFLLGKLSALQSLSLRSAPVADLGPLKSLTALQSLDLSETQVADLGPLKDLTAIQSLDLSET